MRVGHALVRARHGQNRDGDCRCPRDRVNADTAHKGMHNRTVWHGLVKEGAAAALTALFDRGDKGLPVADRRIHIVGKAFQQINMEKAPDKLLIGAVAADIPGRSVPHLKNGDRQGGEVVSQRVGLLVGHDAEIEQVHAPDALIVLGFLRVLVLDQGFVPVHAEDLVKG